MSPHDPVRAAVLHLLDPVIHQSYITTGGQIIIALLVFLGTVLTSQNWVNLRRTKKAVQQTKSNGDDHTDVKGALERIESKQTAHDQVHEQINEQMGVLAQAISRLIEPEEN